MRPVGIVFLSTNNMLQILLYGNKDINPILNKKKQQA